ncbi:MAG: hypothetical protein E7452_02805 [Ruminococcaceae bacterium]|nr:hypothetical protein [Oscillospiraceae bacterium]
MRRYLFKTLLCLFVFGVLFTFTGCQSYEGGPPSYTGDFVRSSLLLPNGTPNFSHFDEELRMPEYVKYLGDTYYPPHIVRYLETIPIEQTYDNLTFTWSKEYYTPADKSITLTITNNNKDVSWFVWMPCFLEEYVNGQWIVRHTNYYGTKYFQWVGVSEQKLDEFTEDHEIPDSYTIGIDAQGYDDEGEFYHLGANREHRLRFYVGNKEFTLPIPTMQIPPSNG